MSSRSSQERKKSLSDNVTIRDVFYVWLGFKTGSSDFCHTHMHCEVRSAFLFLVHIWQKYLPGIKSSAVHCTTRFITSQQEFKYTSGADNWAKKTWSRIPYCTLKFIIRGPVFDLWMGGFIFWIFLILHNT